MGKIIFLYSRFKDAVYLGKQNVIAVAGAIHYLSTYLGRIFVGGFIWV